MSGPDPRRRRGTGRFELQVRAVLLLLVLFLAALDSLNLVLLSRATDAAERSERERAKTRGREVALILGPEALAGRGTGRAIDGPQLARLAPRFDLARVAVLAADGRVTAESGPAAPQAARFADL